MEKKKNFDKWMATSMEMTNVKLPSKKNDKKLKKTGSKSKNGKG